MKVTLKATYGIMAALDLALHNGEIPIRARSIARRQAIPGRFLEQVLNALRKAGLVDSQRGAQGGYLLSRRPDEVSLADIVEALDGPIVSLSKQWSAGNGTASKRKRQPVLASVWERLLEAERNVLSDVTLKDLADRHQQLEEQRALMYHI